MKILLIGDFTYKVYAPAFQLGFEKLGHQVKCIKYDDYEYSKSRVGTFLTRMQNRYHIGYNLIQYNKDIIKAVEEFKPDFVFLYRCYRIWESTIKNIKEKGAYIITYNNDDPFSGVPSHRFFRNFYKNIKLADFNYVYRKKNIRDYLSIGAKTPQILLPYFLEESNFYEKCEKNIDIAYLGHYEQDGRDESFATLIDAGIHVSIYSTSYWEQSAYYEKLKPFIKPGVSGLEYNHNINRSKIALVFLSKANSDTYTRRCFEIPAAKTLMLSEYTDDLAKMFPPNECAVYFRNNSELVEKGTYLLKHPEEVARIANNGYIRLKELGGSEVDRCKEIINTYIYGK